MWCILVDRRSLANRDLKELRQATFLNHGRKAEVIIKHARIVVSPRISNQSSLQAKVFLTISLW